MGGGCHSKNVTAAETLNREAERRRKGDSKIPLNINPRQTYSAEHLNFCFVEETKAFLDGVEHRLKGSRLRKERAPGGAQSSRNSFLSTIHLTKNNPTQGNVSYAKYFRYQ